MNGRPARKMREELDALELGLDLAQKLVADVLSAERLQGELDEDAEVAAAAVLPDVRHRVVRVLLVKDAEQQLELALAAGLRLAGPGDGGLQRDVGAVGRAGRLALVQAVGVHDVGPAVLGYAPRPRRAASVASAVLKASMRSVSWVIGSAVRRG